MTSNFDFVNTVAADRNLVVTRSHDHACRLEPRVSDLAWFCDLDDGTPSDTDRDPASDVRWVCPALKAPYPATGRTVPLLDVRRSGPHSDLGKLLHRFARAAGRASPRTPEDSSQGRLVYTDPTGILDVALRQRIENWPSAVHGDLVVRPAELWSIRTTYEGLIVLSVSWWDSAPALDHQIGLAVEIARRLTAQR